MRISCSAARPARDLPIPAMDKGSGWKGTAFTWAMGNLILLRIAEGETVKAITAHPAMPAYCTVFRWMEVVPEFGEAVRALRAMMAQVRLAERDGLRAAKRRRRKDGGAWHGGRRPGVSAQALGAALQAVRDGASMGEALAAPGAPSAKAFYSRVRGCPGFRAAFVDACDWRAMVQDRVRWDTISEVRTAGARAGAAAALRALRARRGRLEPRLYRTAPSVANGWAAPPRPLW